MRAEALSLAVAASLAVGCTSTYHPEYHPETRYTFVQTIHVGPPDLPCNVGRAGECWRECFRSSRGEACYILGLMFETGNGVAKSHEDAVRMSALASALGYAPASIDLEMAAPYLDLFHHEGPPRRSPVRVTSVTEGGGVVVRGSVPGDVLHGESPAGFTAHKTKPAPP